MVGGATQALQSVKTFPSQTQTPKPPPHPPADIDMIEVLIETVSGGGAGMYFTSNNSFLLPLL